LGLSKGIIKSVKNERGKYFKKNQRVCAAAVYFRLCKRRRKYSKQGERKWV